ncbi:MAG: ATP-binding protein, partial [Bacteroidetes bacterium]|nr:ATP-binding protein [Bacteroidota bacterium]
MLIEFSIDNYLSFKNNNRFRMEAGTIKEHTANVFYPFAFNEFKLVKSSIIYGANGSGKSNLLKAFRFMQQFVLNSSKESQASEDIKIEPFRLNHAKLDYPTTFEVIFLIDKTKYRYGFTVTRQEILGEWLCFTDKRKEEELYTRRGNQFLFDKKLLNEPKNKVDILKDLTRNNSLFISILAQFNVPLGIAISKWFSNTLVIFEANTEEMIDHTASLLTQPVYRKKIHDIIAKSDLGFLNLDAVVKEKAAQTRRSESLVSMMMGAEDSYQVKTAHKVFNDEKKQTDIVLFDLLRNESLGTQKYIALLGVILEALMERKILWIDELDSRFHELLLKMIIGLF